MKDDVTSFNFDSMRKINIVKVAQSSGQAPFTSEIVDSFLGANSLMTLNGSVNALTFWVIPGVPVFSHKKC